MSKRRKIDDVQTQVMEDGTKIVDINKVVFLEDEFKETEHNQDKGVNNKKKKKRNREKQIHAPVEENEDLGKDESNVDLVEDMSNVGLIMSDDFIPDDVFEESLRTGKRARELVEEDCPVGLSVGQKNDDGMVALILTPTRELAIQIKSHMDAVSKYTGIHVRNN